MMLRPTIFCTLLFAAHTTMASTAVVTNNSSFGPGSLAQAIESANNDTSIKNIIIRPRVGTILVDQGIVFTGPQALSINGRGAVLQAVEGTVFDLLTVTNSNNLKLTNLTLSNAGGNGVFLPVASDSDDEVQVSLQTVTLLDNGLHGLFIDDQDDIDKTLGSNASISLTVRNSLVQGNGVAASDFDGIRIDEGGLGDIFVELTSTQVIANGGDGVEFDETNAGDVFLNIARSNFLDNGFQDPNDLEDGVDIDEAGDGDIQSVIIASNANNNLDEGIDFDEEGNGDLDVSIFRSSANNNVDEGIKLDEENDGRVDVKIVNTDALANGDDGLQIEETDLGDLSVKVLRSQFADNGKFGVKVEQGGEGEGSLRVLRSEFSQNVDGEIDLDGVLLD